MKITFLYPTLVLSLIQVKEIQIKKMGGVIIAELVQSSRLPQLTSCPCLFEQSMFLVAGLSHGLSLPPPFVHSTVFSLKHHYPMKGLVREPELLRCRLLEILRLYYSSQEIEICTRKVLCGIIRNIS